MMVENCIQCNEPIQKAHWASKYGFCTPQHYTQYMSKHNLWSSAGPNFSQEHMDRILERMPTIEAVISPFAGIQKYAWLDMFITVEWIAWVAILLSTIIV